MFFILFPETQLTAAGRYELSDFLWRASRNSHIACVLYEGDRKKAHWKKAHRKKAHRKKAHMYISAWEKSALGKKLTRKKAHTEKSGLG